MCAVATVIFGVRISETIIITVLKSVMRKRLVKTKDFCGSCGYSDIWRVWFSGTVIVGCGGDPLSIWRIKERKIKPKVLTLNKYMAMGPSGARCQE
jgi:hypothetical protein